MPQFGLLESYVLWSEMSLLCSAPKGMPTESKRSVTCSSSCLSLVNQSEPPPASESTWRYAGIPGVLSVCRYQHPKNAPQTQPDHQGCRVWVHFISSICTWRIMYTNFSWTGWSQVRREHCSPPCRFQSVNQNQVHRTFSKWFLPLFFLFLFPLPSQLTHSDYRGQCNLTIQPVYISYIPH